jgi:CheY-like chemotaxis protein
MKSECQILLIDDEADMRIALAEILEDEGYTVWQAKAGKNGLLDYMIPEMGGAEFCDKLRLNSKWASIPVALVSAVTLSKEKRASMGLAAFIEKTIQIEKFLAIVEQYCKES